MRNDGLKDLLKLNLPDIAEVQVKNFVTENDFNTRIHLALIEATKNYPVAEQLKKTLENDIRIKNLLGKLVSTGLGSASQFNIDSLSMWFLHYAKRNGSVAAVKALEKYLTEGQVDYLAIQWIIGIETEKKIKLTESVELVPIDLMPDSSEKEYFLQINLNHLGGRTVKPKVALVVSGRTSKINEISKKEERLFKSVYEALNNSTLLLNLVPDLACIANYTTSYLGESVPPGLFSGRGGSMPIIDIAGTNRITVVTSQMISESKFSELYAAFKKLKDDELARWWLIISRLSQAKRRWELADRILDLGIALEMALLEEASDHEQLSLKFRLRGSRILTKNLEERKKIYNDLKDIYHFRSEVAHNGLVPQKEKAKLEQKILGYEVLGSRICSHLLLNNNNINWREILLD